MHRHERLLILGASTRSAAFSALRAGLRPWCIDLFADADLGARCPVVAVDAATYPHSLFAVASQAPPGPWMYTGALENHPRLVQRLAENRPLWGNAAPALYKVRTPQKLAAIFGAAGIPCPRLNEQLGSQPPCSVLVKPVKGSAGRRIRFAEAGERAGAGSYLQEFIPGDPISPLFVGNGETAVLLGVTQQLIGQSWLHAAPFAYCGSAGPLPLNPPVRERLERIGQVLAGTCGLRGLFGVDCLLRDHIPWPVEVNPRYLASVEVLEFATGCRAMDWHCSVFSPGLAPSLPPSGAGSRVIGKAILFAREQLTFPGTGPWSRVAEGDVALDAVPPFADVPVEGQHIKKAAPILTFFACAASLRACLESLRDIAQDLDQRLSCR